MAQYLVSIYQPDEDRPEPAVLDRVMADLAVLDDDLRAAGAWVFNGGLHPPSTGTVVRVRDGDLLLTDGPYLEGKEHLGGLLVIEVADLDAALGWAGRVARATGLPIEVRPFAGGT
jgi:hypothetical protein